MANIDTDKIREEYRTRHKDREWFEVWLQEALAEIDRQREEARSKAKIRAKQATYRWEIEQRTKEAIREYLNENGDVKKEYGPHGVEIWYYSDDDIQEAIDSVGKK